MFIDTHTHIDGEEFKEDLDEVVARAREAGAEALLVPGINWDNVATITDVCQRYPGYCYGMIGLHPEDVKGDYEDVIRRMKAWYSDYAATHTPEETRQRVCAIGEIGLDFYWSREFEQEQLRAFELQVEWAIEAGLPLMIHCRKAQNEMVKILRRLSSEQVNKWSSEQVALPSSACEQINRDPSPYTTRSLVDEQVALPSGGQGDKMTSEQINRDPSPYTTRSLVHSFTRSLVGVFHCFTGNEHEAEELLAFPGFYLGIGGVSTFKKSNLPKTLPAVVPLDRIVLETDSPYMAPVPHRGERNESSFIPHIITKLAEAYGVTEEEVAEVTTRNAKKLFQI